MPVLLSVYMVRGATCEYRRLVLVYVSYTPRDSASSSSNPVHTCQGEEASEWSCLAAAGGAPRMGQPGWTCGHTPASPVHPLEGAGHVP